MITSKTQHLYGPQVHLLEDTFLSGLLAELCHPQTEQPKINSLVQILYTHLIATVFNEQFEREVFETPTRMTATHPDILLKTQRIRPDQKAVCVNLARAGTFPSHLCYEFLHAVLPAKNIRQDHVFASRTTGDKDKVTGSQWSGSKIGGDVKDSVVLFPDPMGATGHTLCDAIAYYKQQMGGSAKKWIALHLIVTPEYLRRMTTTHPEAQIYALRLDRGLSPQAVLKTIPGTHWDQEKGLNEKHYIVPGGGGFGEIMNNSYV